MNTTQRKYFISRVNDILAYRKSEITQYYVDKANQLRSPKQRFYDWYKTAWKKELRIAADALLATLVDWVMSHASYDWYGLPTEEQARNNKCLMPQLADAVLSWNKAFDEIHALKDQKLCEEDQYALSLKDQVMFAETAEELNKALADYQKRALPCARRKEENI